ncbi:MAG: tRNA 5-methoxyuridine(34)/uridine 5-oxyacetic acid(34) synthase CmoB [Gammaproteobacteria bacterium]|nr:MAG: tRNA 5-methoxyuridine(34)/uridine 5-oxyacetic acid(34) synthase CmoB [Gammaproteobacteria bacterium]
MFDFESFFQALSRTPMARFEADLRTALKAQYYERLNGDTPRWQDGFNQLPDLEEVTVNTASDAITLRSAQPLTDRQMQALETALRSMMPWRKGPFDFFGTFVDTEWRSDWKWHRIQPWLPELNGLSVLDVGCGSGYHCWRLHGEGARLVVGADPSQKFLYQFQAVKRYLPDEPVFYLPLKSEDLPPFGAFDLVLSMGVIYHRRSPFDHLDELKSFLRPGGTLLLETIVVDGDANTILTPEDRYAQMRNVWCIPSPAAAERWLRRTGWQDIRTVDVSVTSLEEQRQTDWMRFHSLKEFLAPSNPARTVEGYPAPKRAVILARKPG